MDLQRELSKFGPNEKTKFWKNVGECFNDESWCRIHKEHGVDYTNPDKILIAKLVYQEMYKKKNFIKPSDYDLS